jgi:CRP-like cAMP-binding protein
LDTYQGGHNSYQNSIKVNIFENLIDQITIAKLWEETKILNRNEYLKVAGTIENHLYYIINGSVRIFMIDENEEHTIRFGYQNSIVTCLDSFLTNKKTSFYIQALKKTEYRSVPKIDFYSLMDQSLDNQNLWKQILEAFVIQQMDRETDLLTKSPEERFQRVLNRSPQLFQEIPHKYIASYLRMSPETLSRIKKS